MARILDAVRRRVSRRTARLSALRAERLESRRTLCAGHVFGGLIEPQPLSPGAVGQPLPAGNASWDPTASFEVLLAASTGTRTTLDGTASATAAAANGLPDLHSLPGASTAIYLDFDGDGGSLGAYDVDGNPATFNLAEAATIIETHRQTAAYFAMFDVNVTTVKPTVPFAWIVISGDITGGSSYVGVFPNSRPESWVSSSTAESRVSGVAHELGHNFGLLHQSEYDLLGNKTSEYSNGYDSLHGSIMGVDYRQDVHKWFIGHPSNSASALQDDVAVIAAVIKRHQPAGGDGFRADDFGGTIATASVLTTTNGMRSIAGVIERMADVDTFAFTAGSGGAVISVVPPRPSGLDARVEVFDAAGTLVAASDGDTNEQQIVLPVGGGTWYVSVSSHGNYGDLGMYDLSVNDLPTGWASADVGAVGSLGDAGFGGGTFTVAGSGTAVGGTADSFRFAWQRLTGDGSIVARVTGIQNTNGWAKAGVEIRESLAANSRHVALVATATQGAQLISRSTTGGSSVTVNGTAGAFTPTWVRLVRVGSVITASRSADGVSWTTVGSVTVSMSATVHIGLLSSANAAAMISQATFTSVSFSGTINAAESLNSLPAPAGVAIRQGGGASFVVSWQPVAGATGYVIERSENGVDFTSVVTASSSATSWTNTGLPGAMRYFYRVRASDAAGSSTPSAIVSAVNRPSPVTEAAVTSLSNSQLVLNWIETSGETGYRIERSTDSVTFTQIATVSANVPSYTAAGLPAGTQFWFRISPMSGSGDGNPVVITGSTSGFQAVTDLAFTSKSPTAIGLEWIAVAGATGYRIERSSNGTTFTTLATAAAGATTYTDATVAVIGKYYYRVVALNGAVEANPSPTIFTAAPAALALPKPWTTADVGSVLGEGATGLQSGKFILVGSGTAIGGAADSFRYTSQPLIGDGTIVATVSSLENTGSWAKGGVVIRESLDPNARQAVMALSADNGVVWQYRQNIGGSGVVVSGPTSQTAPVWLKVTRSGNTFTGSWSSDGTTWTQAGTITIPMSATALVGLASTSDAPARLNRVEFTNVTVSNLAPTVATAAVATGIVTGVTSPLTVLGADDHGEANLDYRWTAQGPAAVTFSANGTNAAKSSVATFTKAGGYVLTATITDSSGLTTTSTVSVTVAQTPTTITVSPPTASIVAGMTLQLAAAAADQFGSQLTTQPAFTWAATGGGSITAAGLFTAPVLPATATIRASASSVAGQATVTITTADHVVSVPTGQSVVEAGGRSGIGALVKRGAGTLVLDGANTHAGGTVVEQGELVIRNVAALGGGRLEVRAGGRVTLDTGLDWLTVPALLLDPAGRIDIGAGRLIVAAGLGESAVRQSLLDGHNGGGWDGSRGFVSRSATQSRTIGFVVDQGTVTIAYAAPGDTNLDGVVDVIDVANLVDGSGAASTSEASWGEGDFNYDGTVDQLDLSDFLAAGLFDQGPYLSAFDAAFASLGRDLT